MKIETFSLEDKINEKGFEELAKEISRLPSTNEFREKAENELWGLFAGEESEKITYQNLPKGSRDLIALVSGNGKKLPWWFSSFEWKIMEKGSSNSQEITRSFLKEKIEEYHKDSYILKPKLSSTFEDRLKNLHDIRKELEENLNLATEESTTISFNFFERSTEGIRTSEEFKDWFDETLKKFPPIQDQLTSLLLVYSNMKINFAEEHLDEQVLEVLDNIGMVNSRDRIYNQELVKSTKKLTDFGGVFDLSIDLPNELKGIESDFSPLQILLFHAFQKTLENNSDLENKIKEWMKEAGETKHELENNEKREFASVVHSSPLNLSLVHEDRVNLLFGGSRYSEHYKGARQSSIKKVKSLLRDLGYSLEE